MWVPPQNAFDTPNKERLVHCELPRYFDGRGPPPCHRSPTAPRPWHRQVAVAVKVERGAQGKAEQEEQDYPPRVDTATPRRFLGPTGCGTGRHGRGQQDRQWRRLLVVMAFSGAAGGPLHVSRSPAVTLAPSAWQR